MDISVRGGSIHRADCRIALPKRSEPKHGAFVASVT
jgi:hypothetical protein